MEHDLLGYSGLIGVAMATFLIQKFWTMSNKFSALEARQVTKIEALKELKAEVKEIHVAISQLKICVERLNKQ